MKTHNKLRLIILNNTKQISVEVQVVAEKSLFELLNSNVKIFTMTINALYVSAIRMPVLTNRRRKSFKTKSVFYQKSLNNVERTLYLRAMECY